MVSYLLHVKEPVAKGHLSCGDTSSKILKYPLETGFIVHYYIFSIYMDRKYYQGKITQNICEHSTRSQ